MSTYLITRPTRPTRPAVRRPALRTFGAPAATLSAPAVDVTREGEDGLVTVEAPGLDPGRDLSVTVTGDRLTVAGVRRSTTGGVRREARFSRTLALPEGVDEDAVSADYSAGVLRVRVAGLFPAPVQPETRTVAITSDVVTQVVTPAQAPAEAPADEHSDEAADGSDGSDGSDEQRTEAPAAA